MRSVEFANGKRAVAGWCTHPDCAQHDTHVQAVYEGADYRNSQSQAFTDGQVLCCEKAVVLIDAWGGEMSLHNALAQVPASTDDNPLLHHFHPSARTHAIAVRAGVTFDDWAVLHKHRAVPGYFCTHSASHCRSHPHNCRHIKAAGLEGESHPIETLSADAFEAKLKKDFDLASGRLHGIRICSKVPCS